MAITFADIEDLMTAAIVAMDAGDYQSAITKAVAAQGRLALLPSSERSGGSLAGTQKMTWNPQSITDFINSLRKQQNASGGVQVANVELNSSFSTQGGSSQLGIF